MVVHPIRHRMSIGKLCGKLWCGLNFCTEVYVLFLCLISSAALVYQTGSHLLDVGQLFKNGMEFDIIGWRLGRASSCRMRQGRVRHAGVGHGRAGLGGAGCGRTGQGRER